jgi:hypothetical protein
MDTKAAAKQWLKCRMTYRKRFPARDGVCKLSDSSEHPQCAIFPMIEDCDININSQFATAGVRRQPHIKETSE